MCFDPHDRPPIPPMAGAAHDDRTFELESTDGTGVRAFEARTAAEPTAAAILILPDARGLHPYYEELALRFAESGVDALAIDYFARTAGTGPRPDDFPYVEHLSQARWSHLSADISAAATRLDEAAPGRALFSIGFCYGGRLAFLTATWNRPRFAGSIGFYGVPVGSHRFGDSPAPAAVADEMHGAILGLFGGADPGIPAASIEQFGAALSVAGVPHDLHAYSGAPHSFFDRKATEFASESADAWA
ncbi:MAG TPA: dienelactone hydrolase family protein, partial [Candidatus Acidoferrales bacterium]|nr:dienelactone hydrolase family protein [Candidatus Acidoferrales bacterium]